MRFSDNFKQQTDQTCEKDPFDIIIDEYMMRITVSVVNPTIRRNIFYHCGLNIYIIIYNCFPLLIDHNRILRTKDNLGRVATNLITDCLKLEQETLMRIKKVTFMLRAKKWSWV